MTLSHRSLMYSITNPHRRERDSFSFTQHAMADERNMPSTAYARLYPGMYVCMYVCNMYVCIHSLLGINTTASGKGDTLPTVCCCCCFYTQNASSKRQRGTVLLRQTISIQFENGRPCENVFRNFRREPIDTKPSNRHLFIIIFSYPVYTWFSYCQRKREIKCIFWNEYKYQLMLHRVELHIQNSAE